MFVFFLLLICIRAGLRIHYLPATSSTEKKVVMGDDADEVLGFGGSYAAVRTQGGCIEACFGVELFTVQEGTKSAIDAAYDVAVYFCAAGAFSSAFGSGI